MCSTCEHGKMMAKKGYVFKNGQFVHKKTGKPAPEKLAHHHDHGSSFFNY